MSRRKDSISSFTPISILRSIFLKYDLDYNGYLDADEMEMLFQEECELSHEQAEACAYLLDQQGENAVSFEDFNDWIKSGDRVRNIKDPSKWSLLKAAIDMFKIYDVDKNRVIDRNEFVRLFVDRGGDAMNMDTAYNKMDIDRNNKISFGEFLLWLNWVASEDFLLPYQVTNPVIVEENKSLDSIAAKEGLMIH